jgi:hypothetical protein
MRRFLLTTCLLSALAGCIEGPPENGETNASIEDAGTAGEDSNVSSDAPVGERWEIRIGTVPGEETIADFPLLVRIPADIITDVPSEYHFTADDGETVLPHRNIYRTDDQLGFRVRVPELSTDNDNPTTIWLMEGAAEGSDAPTGDADTVALIGFDEMRGAARNEVDSTEFVCEGLCERAEGIVGRAFSSSDGSMTATEHAPFRVNDGEVLSVGFWAKTTNGGSPVYAANYCVGWFPALIEDEYFAGFTTNDNESTAQQNGCVDTETFQVGYAHTGIDPKDGQWHHYGIVIDRQNNHFRTFFDGERVDDGEQEITSSNPADLGQFRIGIDGNNKPFIGEVDELWAARSAWSEAWYATHVANIRGELEITVVE